MSRRRGRGGDPGAEALGKLSSGVVAGLTRLVEDNADTVAAMLQLGDCEDIELIRVSMHPREERDSARARESNSFALPSEATQQSIILSNIPPYFDPLLLYIFRNVLG